MGEMSYSQFTQYFIEIVDYLKDLEGEAGELLEAGEIVPQHLVNELHRHKLLVNILTQAGEEKYNKKPKQLYKDGWDFWFKEDKELREKRYGPK